MSATVRSLCVSACNKMVRSACVFWWWYQTCSPYMFNFLPLLCDIGASHAETKAQLALLPQLIATRQSYRSGPGAAGAVLLGQRRMSCSRRVLALRQRQIKQRSKRPMTNLRLRRLSETCIWQHGRQRDRWGCLRRRRLSERGHQR